MVIDLTAFWWARKTVFGIDRVGHDGRMPGLPKRPRHRVGRALRSGSGALVSNRMKLRYRSVAEKSGGSPKYTFPTVSYRPSAAKA
jgi:hypothetical protein